MTPGQKTRIDNMSYYELLKLWRFAESGHELLSGEVGRYYRDVMRTACEEIGPTEHTKISKEIGW